MGRKIKVASMFAGIGGIDLGFEQAGYKVVWANEIDKYACQTYRLNFGSDFLVEGDIQEISTDMIPDFDVLIAGFPCQAFSSVGLKKGFEDPRGNLFFETARVIAAKKPSVVFFENVANLVKHGGCQDRFWRSERNRCRLRFRWKNQIQNRYAFIS